MSISPALDVVFKDLFAAEYGRLCRYALTYLQDEHAAEDVVQETFIKIWEQKKELIASAEIRFYLITAVRNNCISLLRKQKKQAVQLTDQTPEPEPEVSFSRLVRREQEQQQQKRIADALDQLPPKCREVFLLIKLHGMSYKQAAETLDLSVKTIENQMGKAIKVLREFALAPSTWLYLIILIKHILTGIGVNDSFRVL